jgi:hypothetical protein
MEITRESVEDAVQKFIKMDSGNRSFSEAYHKGEPFYYKRHKILIVPSVIINRYFGCSLYRMSAKLVEILQNYGAKRVYRQLYENGKQGSAILVWVFQL